MQSNSNKFQAADPMLAREQFAISLRKKKKQQIMNLKRQKLIKASAHYQEVAHKDRAQQSEEFSEQICTEDSLQRVLNRLPSMGLNRSEDIWPVLHQLQIISEDCEHINRSQLAFKLMSTIEVYKILLQFMEGMSGGFTVMQEGLDNQRAEEYDKKLSQQSQLILHNLLSANKTGEFLCFQMGLSLVDYFRRNLFERPDVDYKTNTLKFSQNLEILNLILADSTKIPEQFILSNFPKLIVSKFKQIEERRPVETEPNQNNDNICEQDLPVTIVNSLCCFAQTEIAAIKVLTEAVDFLFICFKNKDLYIDPFVEFERLAQENDSTDEENDAENGQRNGRNGPDTLKSFYIRLIDRTYNSLVQVGELKTSIQKNPKQQVPQETLKAINMVNSKTYQQAKDIGIQACDFLVKELTQQQYNTMQDCLRALNTIVASMNDEQIVSLVQTSPILSTLQVILQTTIVQHKQNALMILANLALSSKIVAQLIVQNEILVKAICSGLSCQHQLLVHESLFVVSNTVYNLDPNKDRDSQKNQIQQQPSWLYEFALNIGYTARRWQSMSINSLWLMLDILENVLPSDGFNKSLGPKYLEEIQEHENEKIYEKALEILETHFALQDCELEQQTEQVNNNGGSVVQDQDKSDNQTFKI